MTFDQLVTTFGPVAALLILALAGGARGTWVFGREFRNMTSDRDEWRRIALAALNVADKVTK